MKSACIGFIHSCALCRAVLELRAREAREREEAHPAVEVRRCPGCGFCYGRHGHTRVTDAPDCFEAGEVERLAQLGVDVE